jgi:enoyl-CoA hydratase/carnithine racemase
VGEALELKTITYEMRGHGAWLTLNRPDKLNVFDPQMVEEIAAVLDRVEADPEAIALVLTGAGRAFCVGGDLSFVDQGMGKGARDPRTVFLERLNTVLCRLEAFPKPVIAAVNGMALAGGLEIVACADIVFASDKAKIGDVHANYGLLPGGGDSQRLPRKLGPNLAKYLLFSGEMLAPDRFLGCGFVHEVLAADQLEARVEKLVMTLSDKSPLMLARTKQLVHDGCEQPLHAALRLELVASEAHANSFDMREGVSAFVEKRKPKFQGR